MKLEDLSKDTQKVFDVLNDESDLACVLIGTSYLAELLASTLKAVFSSESVATKILDPQRGPIGGFATRTDLAYCLGLISKPVYQDLGRIAEIRNQFAHKHIALDFGDSKVQVSCNKLQAWRFLEEGDGSPAKATNQQARLVARKQFAMSVVLLGARIHVDAFGHRRKSRNEPTTQ